MAFRLVTRRQWGARPAKYVTPLLRPSGQTGHWEGPHMGAFTHHSCAAKVRGIQNYHMDNRDWSDIAYNFIVCPHGWTFEGRGVGRKAGASGTAGNNASWAICWLGGVGDPYTKAGRAQMRDCFAYGRSKGAGKRVWGHRDWMSTACPGDAIFNDTNNGFFATGGGGPSTPSSDVLNIGGLEVADMTKDELARWIKDSRDQNEAAIKASEDRIKRVVWNQMSAQNAQHSKTRSVIWSAASRLVNVMEALTGKRIAGRDQHRADPPPTVE